MVEHLAKFAHFDRLAASHANEEVVGFVLGLWSLANADDALAGIVDAAHVIARIAPP